MTKYEPWKEEPSGKEYSYMIRASTRSRQSFMKRNFEFPDTGYIEAQEDKTGIFMERPRMYKPGLYGYVHGWGSYHTPFTMYYAIGSMIWQLAVVKNDEVIFNREDGDRSCRVPRLWIKKTGEAEEIQTLLRNEGTPYASLVADNFAEQHSFWTVAMEKTFAMRSAVRGKVLA